MSTFSGRAGHKRSGSTWGASPGCPFDFASWASPEPYPSSSTSAPSSLLFPPCLWGSAGMGRTSSGGSRSFDAGPAGTLEAIPLCGATPCSWFTGMAARTQESTLNMPEA